MNKQSQLSCLFADKELRLLLPLGSVAAVFGARDVRVTVKTPELLEFG